MSDEFDSLDATEKAAVEGALNNAKRPSDNVVQTAPVKCRYTKSGVCANIAGFCLCRQANFALPSSHDARTGKSAARRAWAGTDGSDEQIFGAKEQIPHGGRATKKQNRQ
jgi:hypothetical protein